MLKSKQGCFGFSSSDSENLPIKKMFLMIFYFTIFPMWRRGGKICKLMTLALEIIS